MALAHGTYALGFGIGFLNLLGTILFFVLIMIAFKTLLRRSYYGGFCGPFRSHHSRHARYRHRRAPWQEGPSPAVTPEPESHYGDDGALETARQRLAKGEITPDEFDMIKTGLKVDANAQGFYSTEDGAIRTARERFARSEISAEEFEAVKKALS